MTFRLPYKSALIAAVLYGLAFPAWESLELFPLAWICLLPLLLPRMLALPFWHYSGISFLFGVLGSLIAGHWTLGYGLGLGALAVIWHGLIVAPPLWVFRWMTGLYGHQRALLLLPFSWTSWEWLAANYQPFFWGALGATQSNQTWLIQFADITGVWGISFWLVALNARLVFLWYKHTTQRQGNLLVSSLFVVLSFLLPPMLYAQWRIHTLQIQTTEAVQLTLLQPNATEAEGLKILRTQMEGVDKTQTDMAVWPESIFTTMPFRDQTFKENIQRWDIPTMMVFIAAQSNMHRPDFSDTYSAAIIINQTVLTRVLKGPVLSLLEPHYRKQRLIPYTELQLVPDWAIWHWSMLQDYFPARMLQADKSSPPLRFTTKMGVEHRFSPLICYEAVFPHLAAHAVQDGAEALFVLANDRPFGKTEAWQAASFARLRAIETRRPVVRTSTSGVIGVIDPLGEWQIRDNSREAKMLSVPLTGVITPPTGYVRWIDLFPQLCLIITCLFGVLFCVTKR